MPTVNTLSRLATGACLLACLLFTVKAAPANTEVPLLEIIKGHTATIYIEEDIGTVALGDPDVAQTMVIKPNTLLINARAPGATSLTLFGKSGYLYDYRLLITHDLSLLRTHLQRLDKRITVESDPNGDAIVLTGTVRNKEVADRAVEAAVKFVGNENRTIVASEAGDSEDEKNNSSRAPEDDSGSGGGKKSAPTSSGSTDQIAPTRTRDLFTVREKLQTKTTRVVNLLMTEDSLTTTESVLEQVLQQVDTRIRVEALRNIFVLKGKVASPAALARALSIADRFVGDGGEPDFSVISDQGGVLAGNTDEKTTVDPVDPLLASSRLAQGRGGGGGGGATAGAVGALRQKLVPNKGNLAQNISRGDVIMAANGRVMSLLQVDEQPRIEIQMRIVAVDRSKTDELGIDWRLDGNKVHIGSKTGGVGSLYPESGNTPTPDNRLIDPARSNLNLVWTPGSYSLIAFLRAIEEKGAATTLSEPLLTAVSGEAASFLVGGAVPIPTQELSPGNATQNATTTTNVVYIDYGLKLVIRPTALENGKISVVLDQAISKPDYDRSIRLLGAEIPAFVQRTASTVTESGDGETWAVAGLTEEEISKSTRQVPFLSQIPILGYVFRSKSDSNSRTELMITVTARNKGYNEPVAEASGKPAATNASVDMPARP